MTTERDIHTLARRLREAFHGRHTAISVNADNYAGGNSRMAWQAYNSDRPAGKRLSPEFGSADELAEWLDKNWLKEVQS